MHAATVEAADWWARPRGESHAAWVQNYQQSLRTRHRDVIVQAVREMAGATSVLEVGCHCGPNLVRLAQDIPTLETIHGIDVNPEAVAAGTAWVQRLGLSERVELAPGRLPERTSVLPDGCVDVVLSCYTLAYIAPGDLDAVLYEMGRLARIGIVVAEPMTDAARSVEARHTAGGYREWAHNYIGASRWIGSWRGCTLTTRDVSPPVDALRSVLVARRD